MNAEMVECLSREICRRLDIDPDGTGYAINDRTQSSLGHIYPLWRYQAVMTVEPILPVIGEWIIRNLPKGYVPDHAWNPYFLVEKSDVIDAIWDQCGRLTPISPSELSPTQFDDRGEE